MTLDRTFLSCNLQQPCFCAAFAHVPFLVGTKRRRFLGNDIVAGLSRYTDFTASGTCTDCRTNCAIQLSLDARHSEAIVACIMITWTIVDGFRCRTPYQHPIVLEIAIALYVPLYKPRRTVADNSTGRGAELCSCTIAGRDLYRPLDASCKSSEKGP